MVRDGEDGFIVAERDVNAIAKALLILIDRPELRVEMGRNAASQAQQKADVVRLTKELEAIYSDMVTHT
jgi:glycosyltransferase involved in cell wall biosynthesis